MGGALGGLKEFLGNRVKCYNALKLPRHPLTTVTVLEPAGLAWVAKGAEG